MRRQGVVASDGLRMSRSRSSGTSFSTTSSARLSPLRITAPPRIRRSPGLSESLSATSESPQVTDVLGVRDAGAPGPGVAKARAEFYRLRRIFRLGRGLGHAATELRLGALHGVERAAD